MSARPEERPAASPRPKSTVLTFAEKTGRWLITPGMLVLLIAGIYLTSRDPWDFSQGWISAAFVIIIVLFGLQGAYYAPRLRKARALAERDIEAARNSITPVY